MKMFLRTMAFLIVAPFWFALGTFMIILFTIGMIGTLIESLVEYAFTGKWNWVI